FQLNQAEDPTGAQLASIMSQEGVDAQFSGALAGSSAKEVVIEGISGFGDKFMMGTRPPEELPVSIRRRVRSMYSRAFREFGPLRMEWATDTHRIWLLQLHSGSTDGSASVIYPGTPVRYRRFEVERGIEELRTLIPDLQRKNEGL